MPKVRLDYEIHGNCSCTVDVPQSVIDEYSRQVDSGRPDCRGLDRMLEGYINYDNMVEQLDEAEDIELTEIKEAAPRAE